MTAVKFGLTSGLVRLLLEEHRSRLFQGSVLLVGNNEVDVEPRQLAAWARELEVPVRQTRESIKEPPTTERGVVEVPGGGAPPGRMTERTLFRGLGFDVVNTIAPGPGGPGAIAHDLNRRIPKVLHDRYDLIVDAWAAAFHYQIPTFMLNLHEMLKVGGRVVHCVPSSGLVDFGFAMYSPTFFFDYFHANQYEINRSYLVDLQGEDDRWDTYAITPGCLDAYLGRMDGALAVYLAATKSVHSTGHRVPRPGESRA